MFYSDNIRTIVDKLNESFFVPDIQRSYVWLQNPKEKRIENLFDSLMRGYPIGSFLFWNLKRSDIETDNSDKETEEGKLNFQLYKFIENYDVRKSHNEKINISQVKSEDLHIVLDGQQRLTSLYIGLRGSRTLKRPYSRKNDANQYEEKFLYLNLLHSPSDDNPDDCYQFEFKTPVEAQQVTEEYLWFRINTVNNWDTEEDVEAYCDKFNYGRSIERLLKRLYTVLSKDQILSYYEEKEKSIDKVLKIFIRVNSGGMQLSYSDLLMSLLTATFKSEIRDKMERVVDKFRDEGFSCIGRDQILKTCLMMSECNHVFKLSNFSKANIRKIESNWDAIIEYLNVAVNLLASFGYRNQLSSGYIACVIAYYLFIENCSKPSKEDKAAISMFVRIAQIRSFYSTGLDGKLSKTKELMALSEDFSEFLQKAYTSFENFRITTEYLDWAIDNVRYGSSAVLPLLQSLYPNLNYGTTSFHIDHIYPRAKFNNSNPLFPLEYIGKENCLFNLQMLEGVQNEEKSDKDPEQWLSEEFPNDEGRRIYLHDNYIPSDFVLNWENLSTFEYERKKQMIQKLQQSFGLLIEE